MNRTICAALIALAGVALSARADIGCYQCWLPPVGALLIVK